MSEPFGTPDVTGARVRDQRELLWERAHEPCGGRRVIQALAGVLKLRRTAALPRMRWRAIAAQNGGGCRIVSGLHVRQKKNEKRRREEGTGVQDGLAQQTVRRIAVGWKLAMFALLLAVQRDLRRR